MDYHSGITSATLLRLLQILPCSLTGEQGHHRPFPRIAFLELFDHVREDAGLKEDNITWVERTGQAERLELEVALAIVVVPVLVLPSQHEQGRDHAGG